ncbi:MAG: class I SAM-dependent methyltransferase [Pseudomonadota bacterium]
MKKKYDEAIAKHYQVVAKTWGLSSQSTMEDRIIREAETNAITSFVRNAISKAGPGKKRPTVCDVGCGNGFTLGVLAETFPRCTFVGVEKTPELRALARKRLEKFRNVQVIDGDIRDPGFLGKQKADVLICQRVLINLMDRQDQTAALDNIVNAVAAKGCLLFLECFESSLANLNTARQEFDLNVIPPAHHNLYLSDLSHPRLDPYRSKAWRMPANFLSTHYFVTRVLHPVIAGTARFKRNSEFVAFLSNALAPAIGEYAPLRLCAFRKKS